MKDQLLDTWSIHHKMNLLLLDAITDEGMQQSLSSRGGRTVFQQWVHVHNVRMQWLEICAKDIAANYQSLGKDIPYDRKALLKALDDSAKGIAALLERGWDDGGKIKGFKKGVLPLLGYFISHESHHRGNTMLTLKQTGQNLPDSVKWGIWEWGK